MARDRKKEIIDCAEDVVREQGLMALTYEAVAQRLEVTKQAIIYWFPKKEALMAELNVRAIRNEAEALRAAVDGLPPEEAVRAVVHTMLRHHESNRWDSLRLLYVVPQTLPEARVLISHERRAEEVYPVTEAFYDAFETALRPALGSRARQAAVSIHLAAMGLANMAALMDSIDDAMKQQMPALADALSDLIAEGVEGRVAED